MLYCSYDQILYIFYLCIAYIIFIALVQFLSCIYLCTLYKYILTNKKILLISEFVSGDIQLRLLEVGIIVCCCFINYHWNLRNEFVGHKLNMTSSRIFFRNTQICEKFEQRQRRE